VREGERQTESARSRARERFSLLWADLARSLESLRDRETEREESEWVSESEKEREREMRERRERERERDESWRPWVALNSIISISIILWTAHVGCGVCLCCVCMYVCMHVFVCARVHVCVFIGHKRHTLTLSGTYRKDASGCQTCQNYYSGHILQGGGGWRERKFLHWRNPAWGSWKW